MTTARTTMLALILSLGACLPDIEEADSLISEPRVLAVRAEPAELARGQTASFEALYVDASRRLERAALDWAFCLERKPLAELGPVARGCLVEQGDALAPIGEGLAVEGKVPMDACRSFGPDRPPPKDDEPAGRPVDPDPTGGYYQPVRLYDRDEGAFTLFPLRVTCNLPGVAQPISAQYARDYRANENPVLEALRVPKRGADLELAPDDSERPFVLAPGERIALRASWEPAETYLYFDLDRRELIDRREAMRLSWFSTAGTFDEPRTGRSEAQADDSTSDNAWTAPGREGEYGLWLVLRDDRGGVSFRSYAVRVER